MGLQNAIFASVFIAQTSPQESQTSEVTEKVQGKKGFPLVEEDQVRNHLNKLDIHKCLGPEAPASVEEVGKSLLKVLGNRRDT